MPPPFAFKTTKLCISIYTPIETQQKKASVTISVPAGKTMKELSYYLGGFISGGKEDASNSASLSLDKVVNDEFVAFVYAFYISEGSGGAY